MDLPPIKLRRTPPDTKQPDTAPADPVDDNAPQWFQQAVREAKPLPPPNRVDLSRPLPKPIPQQRLQDEQQVLLDTLSDHIPWEADIQFGDELLFARPGITSQVLRKLRRGQWVIQAELDLHGLNSDQARQAVAGFLQHAMKHDQRCVRIIHGKGMGSRQREPILKRKVQAWLVQRDEVLAFCQARRQDGGSGAVIVLLRARG